MDYFNIRFILKFIKKYKKFFIFFSVFIILIILKNNVFAFTFEYEGNSYTVTDPPSTNLEYQTIVMYYNSDLLRYELKFFASTTPVRPYYPPSSDPTGHTGMIFKGANGDSCYTCNMNKVNGTWGTLTQISNNYAIAYHRVNNSTYGSFVAYWSNHELKVYNSSSDAQLLTNNYFIAVEEPPAPNYAPQILNPERIPTWNFSTLNISGGSYFSGLTLTERSETILYIYYANHYSELDIKQYMEYVDEDYHVVFYVPIQKLLANYNIVGDEVLNFVLKTIYHEPHQGGVIVDYYDLGTYTLNIDSTSANIINANSDKEQLANINEGIQETNQSIEQLNDTISDDTITSSASDLPSVNVTDPSQSGIDNIFQSIYNAFCTGQASDIIFPIPFTNKNITLSPNYVKEMLINNGGNWIYTLIQAFWGYLIGRYIVQDVSRKITKIKGGNIENIENENIKEEML